MVALLPPESDLPRGNGDTGIPLGTQEIRNAANGSWCFRPSWLPNSVSVPQCLRGQIGGENPVTVSIDASVEAIVDDIVSQLGLSPADSGANSRNRA